MNYSYMSNNPQIQDLREISGTPSKQYLFASISASSQFVLDIKEDEPSWSNYLPFNSMTFTNNGGTDIMLYINQDSKKAYYIPSGVIKTIHGDFGIWSLTVVNLSTTTATTTNQLVAEFERSGMDSNNLSKAIAKSPLGRLLIGNLT